MSSTDTRPSNLARIEARIDAACRRAGRDRSEVTLIAVTKGHDVAEIDRRLLQHGHTVLGENRVQEWRDKAEALSDRDVEWHFVGNLQRNKVKYCTDIALIHSLNSIRLADTLQQQGDKRGTTFRVMVELNVAGEDSKQGAELADAEAIVRHAQTLSNVEVLGLMTIAPYSDDPEDARPVFRRLRELRDRLELTELSMGMSGDFEVAIEEGATFVRIGSALFADDTSADEQ
ncbi:MAG: YggS family pyridoxal phosphate-dependent enzyme [Trueperaceae bacterium]|nr:YggS family pyridoxal phosphate-dependent enzyme [Trueperaceae bacterium]